MSEMELYDYVRSHFDYDEETGDLIWMKVDNPRSNRVLGKRVGSLNGHGYLRTTVNKKSFQVHSLVWLWHNKVLPKHEIDHINRNPLDNRIENLRDVTHQANLSNSNMEERKNKSKTGYVGVGKYTNPITGITYWTATVSKFGKKAKTVYKKTLEEAVLARKQLVEQYHGEYFVKEK
jgi:hypothetical protein